MKKSFIAIAAIAFSTLALATGPSQQVTTTLVNAGSLGNTVQSSANVTGVGTAYSAATSEGSVKANTASSTKTVLCGGCGETSGTLKVTGDVATSISGTAFNVSSGAGNGSASATGNASAGVDAKSAYAGPGQTASVYGNAEQAAAINVDATKNTGGFANSGNTGTFVSEVNVGSKTCTGTENCGTSIVNKEVWGSVKDTKTSTSFANTGAMTVDGVVLNQAPVNASANTVVNAGGKFHDPQ